MNGNWEIVIGAITGTISGFIIATFADIFKGWIQRKIEHNQLRNMLYQEVLNNHRIVQSLNSNLSLTELKSTITYRLSIEGYEYIKTNRVSLFYELREASCLNELYSVCKQLKSISNRTSKESTRKLMNELFMLFVHFVETGALEENRLHKLNKQLKSEPIYKWVG
jgi:hypothetical protein